MAALFPGALPNIPQPTAAQKLNTAGYLHAALHTLTSQEILQLAIKIGISQASAQDAPLANTVLASGVNGQSKWRQIVSSDITDGTISTADIGNNQVGTQHIAVNQVSQASMATGSASSPTTTSVAFVDMPDMSVTMTMTAGSTILAWLTATVNNNTLAALVYMALRLNSGGEVGQVFATQNVVNNNYVMTSFAVFTGHSAGSNTIKGRWAVSNGQGTCFSTAYRHLLVAELKR